jgi:protein-disulfide isomerase
VTIVEFTDYQCPSCAYTQPIIEDILKEYGDRLRLVVRNFPLDQHQNAFKAAEAAEAAREQGKYWEYIAILFHNQSALGTDKLKEYATQLGLDRAKFDAALDSGRFAERVQQDIQDGMKLGIDSTPTVFINGRKMQDQKNHDSIKAAVESALKDTPSAKDAK